MTWKGSYNYSVVVLLNDCKYVIHHLPRFYTLFFHLFSFTSSLFIPLIVMFSYIFIEAFFMYCCLLYCCCRCCSDSLNLVRMNSLNRGNGDIILNVKNSISAYVYVLFFYEITVREI